MASNRGFSVNVEMSGRPRPGARNTIDLSVEMGEGRSSPPHPPIAVDNLSITPPHPHSSPLHPPHPHTAHLPYTQFQMMHPMPSRSSPPHLSHTYYIHSLTQLHELHSPQLSPANPPEPTDESTDTYGYPPSSPLYYLLRYPDCRRCFFFHLRNFGVPADILEAVRASGLFEEELTFIDRERVQAFIDRVGPGQASGLSREAINSFPTRIDRKKDGEDQSCVVCISTFAPREVLRSLLPCQHSFHLKCIDRWLKDNNTCPICRVQISARQ